MSAPKPDQDRATTLRIEQAIARGLSAPQIVAALDVSAATVHTVWDALDAAVGIVDEPGPADEAFDEAQAFYSRTCREYHNGAA